MARDITLTRNNIEKLYRAFEYYFPENGNLNDGQFSTEDLVWSNRNEFVEDVAKATDIVIPTSNDKAAIKIAVKKAQLAMEARVEKREKLESTDRPSVETLDTFKEEAERRE